MRRLPLLCSLVLLSLGAGVARAQSMDDLELRQRRSPTRLGFGMLGLMETSAGLNRDRPELSNLLYLAPQLKIGDRMRLRLNVGLIKNWLGRQENPWDLLDVSLQFSHLGFYKERHTGVLFSGYGRWYFPTSKLSRETGSYGQARAVGKASRSFGPLYVAFELNGQKYFHKNTTPSVEPAVGTAEWVQSAGRDGYVENNVSFGFGETLTVAVSPLAGLDLSAIYGLYQSRAYQPAAGHSASAGSELVAAPRETNWSHAYRLILDATYNLGALPAVQRSPRLRDSLLGKMFVSLGYSCLAPQLQNGHRDLNPFNPKYAYAYLDLLVMY